MIKFEKNTELDIAMKNLILSIYFSLFIFHILWPFLYSFRILIADKKAIYSGIIANRMRKKSRSAEYDEVSNPLIRICASI